LPDADYDGDRSGAAGFCSTHGGGPIPKYGIPDLRAFFESDLRWLRHYGFAALDVPTLQGGISRR
jgi:hypothetical protein